MRWAIRRTPAGVALHLREHDVVGVELAADALKVAERPGLKQRRGIPDDAEGRDALGRRQTSDRGIGYALGDPVEILHSGLVVERHDGNAEPPIDRGLPARRRQPARR